MTTTTMKREIQHLTRQLMTLQELPGTEAVKASLSSHASLRRLLQDLVIGAERSMKETAYAQTENAPGHN